MARIAELYVRGELPARARAAASMLLICVGLIGAAGPSPSLAATTCDRVAAPSGSDSAAGTVAGPYRTAQKLVDSLSAGQTGCLRTGIYDSNTQVKVSTPGVTLSSYPGEHATLVARLWIANTAHGATVEELNLNGRNPTNLPSPTVNADDTVFRNNDVTNEHTAICFNLGHTTYGRADRTLIVGNRIYDCGRLPVTNHDHGIYVAHSRDSVIRQNWIYDNVDRGIQLYPDADGTTITGNVIDGNGEGIIFSGNDADVSSDNLVEGNLITNSTIRYNVESNWGAGGTGLENLVAGNCISGGARDSGDGGIQSPQVGFTAVGNLTVDPGYVDRAGKDFRLRAGSPCAVLLAASLPAGSILDPGGGTPGPGDGTPDPGEDVSDLIPGGDIPGPGAEDGATTEAQVTLKANKRAVRRGRKVALKGKVTAETEAVWIAERRGRKWRMVRQAKLRGDTFKARVRVRKRKAQFRAETAEGYSSGIVRVRGR